MQKVFLLVLLLILSLKIEACTYELTHKSCFESLLADKPRSWKSFWRLSGPERCWVITHPFLAKKAFQIALEARAVSKEMEKDSLLDGDSDGGRVDAFRHAYWMARMAQTFCWKKAVKLGKAHEKGNYKSFKKRKLDEELVLPDSASSIMDLHNNDIGAAIGCLNPVTSQDSLKSLVRESIVNGKMMIISKNPNGKPKDCLGELIDMSKYSNSWNIPKCLISSGF